MNDRTTLAEARARADFARVSFRRAADDALGWLNPARLKAEAAMAASHQIDEAKDALRRQVRGHPLIAWSALAAIATLATYLLRKPAIALAQGATHAGCALYHRIIRRKA